MRIAHRTIAAAVAGVALEVAVIFAIGRDDTLVGVRGIGGETAALLAVSGAVFFGPAVGVAMAIAGWAVFFPLIAHDAPASIAALPEWAGVALVVGVLSGRLVRAERERTQLQDDLEAAHALRTPVATVHGLAEVLAGEPPPHVRGPIQAAILDETRRLLDSPLLRRDGAPRQS